MPPRCRKRTENDTFPSTSLHCSPTAALILTLLAPSTLAEQVSATPQISQLQEPHIENNAVAILGTIIDIFSCKHHLALPWCN